MASIFSENSILSNWIIQVNYYCLVCAEHFMTKEETLAHIVDPQHKDKLESCGYFEKYKEHFIRKISAGLYFCEPCGLTFPTATKVALHVDTSTHIQESEIHKTTKWIKRVKNNIIAFDKYLISEEAWNGFIDDTCILCNTEFEDSAGHKASRGHILNLISNMNQVELDLKFHATYRTISPESKQCLTCNIIIGNDPADHIKTGDHRRAYDVYDPRTGGQTNVNNNKETVVKKVVDQKDVQNKLKQPVDSSQKEDVKKEDVEKVDVKTKYVENKDVKKKDVEKEDVKKEDVKKKDVKKEVGNKKEVKNNLKHPADSSKKNTAAELDALYCKTLGAKNYITTDSDGTSWCVLCEWVLDNSPTEHTRSKHHQALLKLHKERLENKSNCENIKKPLFECVDDYQKYNVNIDLINETAVCKKCSKNIDFNTDAIEKHIEEHKKTPNKNRQESAVPFPSGIKTNGADGTTLFTKPVLRTAGKAKPFVSSAAQAEEYAKQHGLSHNRADNSFYCKVCSRRLPHNLEDLEKHIESTSHKENTAKQSSNKLVETKAPVKLPLFSNIETFELVEHITEGANIIINEKYWINAFAFYYIAKYHERIMCHACDIDLTTDNVMDHIISETHRGIVEKCLLITSLEDEFIREIKLDVYHCGYCNTCFNDWDDILEHIATVEHKRKNEEQQRFLDNHSPNPFQRVHLQEMQSMLRAFLRQQRYYKRF